MASGEKFCLRWNDFETNISTAFREIRDEKDLFDCTLSCGPRQLQAHKLILSACSPFFREIFKQNPHQHPLLYLKGIGFEDLKACLNFMYHGEVNVAQDDLNTFLVVAEELKIKGLTQNNGGKESVKKDVPSPATAPIIAPPHRQLPTLTPKAEPFPKRARLAAPVESVQPAVDDDIVEVEPEVKTEPPHDMAVAAMAEGGYEEESYDYGEYNPEPVEYEGGLVEQGDTGKGESFFFYFFSFFISQLHPSIPHRFVVLVNVSHFDMNYLGRLRRGGVHCVRGGKLQASMLNLWQRLFSKI